jgi:hypothetical protein
LSHPSLNVSIPAPVRPAAGFSACAICAQELKQLSGRTQQVRIAELTAARAWWAVIDFRIQSY